ncbi:MAG TPA: hypothetical protein ENJ40_04525 [Thermosulfurimonas dismutans]|uniref:Uncharacterized protein n=1 Tax=Thermosulfurimonas dismutans TaxID=999894 RepID=A0A7C3CG00_9BACT|nr:hypothetical protein [Thermosulfurimonas dismutans]
MRARVELDRVREQAREEPEPERREESVREESVLTQLAKQEQEARARAEEEARRRAEEIERERERVSRETRPTRGYIPSPGS